MNTQVVLITGRADRHRFAANRSPSLPKKEHTLLCPGRRDKEGQELATELQGLGAEAIFVRTDVRNEDDVRDLVDRTRRGPLGRLDVAVNLRRN